MSLLTRLLVATECMPTKECGACKIFRGRLMMFTQESTPTGTISDTELSWEDSYATVV